METILSKEALDWFDKSRRQMHLFQRFFVARTKLERKIELQWTEFSIKWRNKFEDTFKETMTPSTFAEQTMDNIITLLVDEAMDNGRISGSVLSLLERKPRNPDALLKRWLDDPVANTTCYQIDQFKDTFKATIKYLEKSEETVENAKKVLQEKTEVFTNPDENASNKKKGKAKLDPVGELGQARETYQRSVQGYQQMEEPFTKEMTNLNECLTSFENNRLSVLKNALDLYQTAMNQYEKRRESRKVKVKEMKEYFNGFSVEESVKQWLNSLKQPFNFHHYLDDPFPVDKQGSNPVIKTSDDVEYLKVEDMPKDGDYEKENDKNDSKEDSVTTVTVNHSSKATAWDEESDEVEFHKHKVVALESYTNLLPDHLSFHTGQTIQQKKPANADGLAYGYILTNKYTRNRQYGFFPAKTVATKLSGKKRRVKQFFNKKMNSIQRTKPKKINSRERFFLI